MPSDGDPGEDVLNRPWSWSEQTIERADQARNDRDPAGVAEEA